MTSRDFALNHKNEISPGKRSKGFWHKYIVTVHPLSKAPIPDNPVRVVPCGKRWVNYYSTFASRSLGT